MTTLTLPPTQSAHTGSLSIGGAYYATTALKTSSNLTNSASMQGQLTIQGNNSDIVIGDKSMVTWMEKVEARLYILEPKKELLEKYEALQQAYSHFKMLEALLYEEK